MNKIRKIIDSKIFSFISGLIKAFLLTVIILYLSFIVLQRITNNSSIMGYRVFNVASASMDPVYKVGEVILVKEVVPGTLKIGDDITYLGNKQDTDGITITHRIVRIDLNENNRRIFYTKGLNNIVEDPVVEEQQIYGQAKAKLNIISFINRSIRNIYGFFFLIFVPLVLVIFLEIADTVMDYVGNKKEDDYE